MRNRPAPMGMLVFVFLLMWVPYVAVSRAIAVTPIAGLGNGLSGLEILPTALFFNAVTTFGFIWVSGWWRSSACVGPPFLRVPRPTRWTALSGVGSGLLLIAVPLSYTFHGVSIPFIQILMRGDVLLIAPLVDSLAGRRIRPVSWIALGLVAVGVASAVHQRGGAHLPLACWLTIAVYTAGYFLRLWVMTRIAKTDDVQQLKRFFVQEQVVATPIALVLLAILAMVDDGAQGSRLRFGFAQAWHTAALPWLGVVGVLSATIGLLATLILLDKRENSFCVPLERSASVLGGVAATYLLAIWLHTPPPTGAELFGMAMLVAAITLLTLSPASTAGRDHRPGRLPVR